ncbi:MAG: hypothetical protein QOE36_2536 [Gaiellaceae bacterium]|nr:hypothetical protein [Gaiellaceae bacterium]
MPQTRRIIPREGDAIDTDRRTANDIGAELRLQNAELEERVAERTAALEKALSELEAERARLSTILAHVPAGVVVCAAPSGHAVYANERAAEIVGHGAVAAALGIPERPGDAAGQDANFAAGAAALLRQALDEGKTVAGELELDRPDGARVTVEMRAAPITTAGGEVTAAALILQDVSGRNRRERAEHDFVANAAHELRTPLTAITSAIEVLQAGAKESPEARDLFLGHVEREAARLRRLAHSLLVLVRAQTQVEAPRLEILEAEPLLRAVADGADPGTGVTVEVRCEPGLALLANGALVEQALGAMVSNAVRHTVAGRIELAAEERDGRLELSVTDTGEGFDSETAKHVFERFYRGSDRRGGFGLGLAIARDAVEACGGTLTLTSEHGRGTRGTITVAAARMVGA